MVTLIYSNIQIDLTIMSHLIHISLGISSFEFSQYNDNIQDIAVSTGKFPL